MTARRTRAVPTLLVTVGLCAVAGLTGPAVSAGATTTTVAADVDLTAGLTPVEGGDSVDDPTSVTAGRYVDTFPEGDGAFRTYNIERTVPGSVINYGVTVLEPEARASVTSVMLLPDSPASDLVTCGSLVRQDEVRATTMPLTTFGGISLDTPRCVAADSMDIGVIADDGDNPPAPGTPFELVVWETPQPANVEELLGSTFTSGKELVGVAADEVERQVEPGASAARAAVLPEPGGYHVDLPLGRVNWFAVDVPDGSLLAAQAEVHDLERTNQGGTLELRVVGPGGGFANPPQLDLGLGDFETVSGSVGTIGLDPLLVQTQSASVGPAGYSVITSPRQARTDNTALTTTAGWYYVVAYAQNLTGEEDATLPVTLTTDVLDADVYALDQPRYDGPEPEALPGPEAVEPTAYDGAAAEAERREAVEAAEAAEEAELAAAGEDQPIPWWFWLVAVLVVVLAAGVAVLLARRTSRARRPVARPGPGGPPGGFGPGGPPGGFGPGGPPGGFGPGGPRPGGFGPGGPRPGAGQGPATPPTVVRPGSPPAGQRPPGQAPTPQGPPPPAAPWQPGDASTRERPER